MRKHLNLMKWNKSSGPDGIQINVMKKCPNMIPWLCKLYEKSLRTGHCPQYWKDAHIPAIHKNGVRSKCGNYRPISLTSQVVKLMERIVLEKLWEHLLENELINTHQHGFQYGRSCVTQLLECFHQWTDDLNMGKGTDTICFDFSKAFDSVTHSHLLYKLHHYGIRGKLLLLLKSFLTNRRQRVVQQQHMSAWSHDVVSGVPQGTISGPVLFHIFVNDIPEYCNTNVKLFADDTKLFNNNTDRT